MKLKDLIFITHGSLSICNSMIGDDVDVQQDKLEKAGITSAKWKPLEGEAFSNTLTGISSKYLLDAFLLFVGTTIHHIVLHLNFSAYPYAMADSFLGVAKKMGEEAITSIRPIWNISEEYIFNRYRVHNLLYAVEVNVQIARSGATAISLELSGSQANEEGELLKESIGIYKNINELIRRSQDLEENLRKPKPNTIFF